MFWIYPGSKFTVHFCSKKLEKKAICNTISVTISTVVLCLLMTNNFDTEIWLLRFNCGLLTAILNWHLSGYSTENLQIVWKTAGYYWYIFHPANLYMTPFRSLKGQKCFCSEKMLSHCIFFTVFPNLGNFWFF